jgi:hypothetical protein
MIIGALEGGSNYWYRLNDTKKFWDLTAHLKGEKATSERVAAAVLDFGASLEIEDIENGEKLGVLSLETIEAGEKIMHDNHMHHYADILKEQDDAATADVWFQLAVMGDIVYG